MPVNSYECLVLFDTSKISGSQDAARAGLHSTLEKYGAEILVGRNWDERKLAYPIDGQKKGLYYLTYFKADASKIDPIQKDLKINENILRFMTIKIPEKWETEMRAVAQDETKLAYQAAREETEGGMGGGERGPGGPPMGDEGGEDRPRRGRRDDGPMKD